MSDHKDGCPVVLVSSLSSRSVTARSVSTVCRLVPLPPVDLLSIVRSLIMHVLVPPLTVKILIQTANLIFPLCSCAQAHFLLLVLRLPIFCSVCSASELKVANSPV
jgi:hypothetical protein